MRKHDLNGFGIPFRLNLNRNGGGIMLSIRNNISAKVVCTDNRPFWKFLCTLEFWNSEDWEGSGWKGDG